MNAWLEKKSRVTKLRVKGENLDLVATRLHFERLFGATNFLPAGLSPNAIVCIKKISDPKPQTLRLSHADLQFSEIWRKNVSREIEKLYQKAYRPIREIIPAQAESVIFSDQAELLACLASDFCDGSLLQNWWWKSLFPNLNQAQTAVKIWLEAAEFAPNALQILSNKQKAVEFTAKLDEAETKDLLTGILQTFGLNHLQNSLFEPLKKLEIKEIYDKSESQKKLKNADFDSDFQTVAPISPFSDLLPETRNIDFSFLPENLLGIGLLLARFPRIARSNEFAAKIKTYRAELEIIKEIKIQTIAKITENQIQKSKLFQKNNEISADSTQSESEKISPKLKQEAEQIDVIEPKKQTKNLSNKVEFLPSDKPEISFSDEIIKPLKKTPEKPAKIRFEKITDSETAEKKEENRTKKVQKKKVSTSIGLKNEFEKITQNTVDLVRFTRFGGVFYLLNLAIYLELYRDFTENLLTEIDLNIWDFITLLAVEFLSEEIKKDSIWNLLQTLGGRENEEDSEIEFLPEKDWRIPQKWLETFQNERNWFWSSGKNRLIVCHQAGFKIVDVELIDKPEIQLNKELENYRSFFDEITESNFDEETTVSPLQNWLKNLCEYIKARLFQALNVKTIEEINEILFKRQAQINVSANHLEINFSLADLPLEIRFSGLDRDPGWIPAVGKFVKFNFS